MLNAVHLRDVRTFWAISALPPECPRAYAVQRFYEFEGQATPGPRIVYPSLEEARRSIPLLCARLERVDFGDPAILETWA